MRRSGRGERAGPVQEALEGLHVHRAEAWRVGVGDIARDQRLPSMQPLCVLQGENREVGLRHDARSNLWIGLKPAQSSLLQDGAAALRGALGAGSRALAMASLSSLSLSSSSCS